MKKAFLVMMIAISIVFVGCKKEKDAGPEVFTVGKGVFILNEGTFTYANASLSFYDFDKNEVENNLFFRVNDAPVGDVGQSLTKIGNDLYIVVNNSRYIYKVNAKTIKYKEKIEGFNSPRYMLQVSDNKAYVSDIESPGFWKMDLSTNALTFIQYGSATEAMVKVGNEVFMSNWSNYYVPTGSNKSVQVIDCEADTLVATIEVAQEPNSMVVDKNNHIWVSCSGGYMPPCDPAIICIDAATHEVIKRFDLTDGSYPSGLTVDAAGENIYFMNGGYGSLNVYKVSADANELPNTPFIASEGKLFYNLKVNPQNGELYVTDAKNYVQNGDLLRYSADGTLLGTFSLGIIPSYMLFN
jgi:DNA-binding beta-propeller fold protein YncE